MRRSRAWWGFLSPLATAVADTIAPARCMRCLAIDSWLCQPCYQHILQLPYHPACIGCGRSHTPRGHICVRCRSEYVLTGVLSFGSYKADWLARGIKWLKFKGVHDVARPLAQVLTTRLLQIAPLAQLQSDAVMVPIPLHQRRLRQRGFNQSELLSTALSNLTDIPTRSLLVRQRATWQQANLPHHMRQENVTDAFAVIDHAADHLRDRRFVLLIDDVTTTGATLDAAARALRAAGFKQQIWGVTVARG